MPPLFVESYLCLTATLFSPSCTKEQVLIVDLQPVSIGTETDQRNECSDNASEEMGSQGMVDTVNSPDMVAAFPDWERNIHMQNG